MIVIATGVKASFTEALHAFALLAYDGISEGTPVDTAQARSNWFVGIGEPALAFDPLSDYGKRRGKKNPDVSQVAADIAISHAVIETWDGEETLYIANSTPYIGYINEGGADSGFVEFALASAFNELRQSRIIG